MSVNNGIITAPIETWDPYTALGMSATAGVGYDIGTICASGRINIWARFKPMRYDSVRDITDEIRKSLNYGLAVPDKKTLPANTKTDVWGYNAPRGSVYKEDYRLDDFVGYFHGCSEPVAAMTDVDFNILFNTRITFSIHNAATPSSLYNITLSDIPAIKDYYVCLALTLADGTVLWKTSDGTIANGAREVTLNAIELPHQTNNYVYEYYLCACSARKTSFTATAPTAYFMALPTDDVAALAAALTIKRTLPLTFDIIGLASKATPQVPATVGFFGPANRFVGEITPEQSNDARYYMPCGTYYNLQLQLDVENTGTTAVSISINQLRYSLGRTFATANEVGPRTFIGMYELVDGSYVSKSSLTFAAGETKRVALFLENYILRYDGSAFVTSPTAGQLLKVTLYLNYDSYTHVWANIIRLRN